MFLSMSCWYGGTLNNKLVFRCISTSVPCTSLTCCKSFDNKRIKPKFTFQQQCYRFLISSLTFARLDNSSHTVYMKVIFWCPSGKLRNHYLSPMYIISLSSNRQVLQIGEPHHGSRLLFPLGMLLIMVYKTFKKISSLSTITITTITIKWVTSISSLYEQRKTQHEKTIGLQFALPVIWIAIAVDRHTHHV